MVRSAGVMLTLMHRRRPGAHDERPVHELISVAVTGHPVQVGDGERAAEAGPRLVDQEMASNALAVKRRIGCSQ